MTNGSRSQVSVNMEAHVRKATVDGLGREEHFAAYTRALGRVLLTDISRSTYAQIADGAPLSQTVSSMPEKPSLNHPIYKHSKLCDGVPEKVEQILNISTCITCSSTST